MTVTAMTATSLPLRSLPQLKRLLPRAPTLLMTVTATVTRNKLLKKLLPKRTKMTHLTPTTLNLRRSQPSDHVLIPRQKRQTHQLKSDQEQTPRQSRMRPNQSQKLLQMGQLNCL